MTTFTTDFSSKRAKAIGQPGRWLSWLGMLGLLGLLAGCGFKLPFTKPALPPQPVAPVVAPVPTPAPAQFAITRRAVLKIMATDTVNPDATARPSPLSLRIYQLKAAPKFQAAPFFPLFDESETTLKADLISSESVLVLPGAIRTVEMELNQATKFLGFVSAYQRIDDARWRAIYTVNDDKLQQVTVQADTLQLSVVQPAK